MLVFHCSLNAHFVKTINFSSTSSFTPPCAARPRPGSVREQRTLPDIKANFNHAARNRGGKFSDTKRSYSSRRLPLVCRECTWYCMGTRGTKDNRVTHPLSRLVVEGSGDVYGSCHVFDGESAAYVTARDLISNTRC